MSPSPPAKPTAGYAHRPTSIRPSFAGDDREFVLEVIREQTAELGGKIDSLQRDTDGRLMALEKARLEDDRMRLSVQTLTVRVEASLDTQRALLESDKLQNMSLESLTRALRPAVEATASLEGSAAGAKAGKLSGRVWGLLGSALALLLAGALQQCEQQISRGALTPLPASSAK